MASEDTATQQHEPQPSMDEMDIDDMGLFLFIEMRERVAREWGHKQGASVSRVFLDGIDAEANKRIREDLVRLRLQVAAPVEQSKPSLEKFKTVARAAPLAYAAGRLAGLEEAAVLCDKYERDGRDYKEYACETADEIAARIRALKESQR